jgi:hypothetical protein
MGLPANRLDHEESAERQIRLQVIAAAVADVAEQATCNASYETTDCSKLWPGSALGLGVLLVTQAYEETRLARNVHEGKCRSYECDPVRVGSSRQVRHRARSLWQIHHSNPVDDEWNHMVGTDYASTRAAAWAATKLLTRGYRACGNFVGAISRYAGLTTCRWSGAERRGKLVVQLLERARRFERASFAELTRRQASTSK